MRAKPFLKYIFANDAMMRGLGDEESRVLVEWLVEQTEELARDEPSDDAVWLAVRRLCSRARSVSRFVDLWCHRGERGAANQLAVTERFEWPLPEGDIEACELMAHILSWEEEKLAA